MIGGRFDAADRQRHDQQRSAAERIVVLPENRSPFGFDLRRELIQRARRNVLRFGRRQPDGAGRHFLPTHCFLLRHRPILA
jgi:hypothetical protein